MLTDGLLPTSLKIANSKLLARREETVFNSTPSWLLNSLADSFRESERTEKKMILLGFKFSLLAKDPNLVSIIEPRSTPISEQEEYWKEQSAGN